MQPYLLLVGTTCSREFLVLGNYVRVLGGETARNHGKLNASVTCWNCTVVLTLTLTLGDALSERAGPVVEGP